METLATSDYNYAGHVKELFFDTAIAGDAGEKACKEFSYEHTCGKFLNTLLLAVLKRTKCLEAFYWNCRIELSTAIYQTLHRMPNLRRIHVRLQPGPSLHSTSGHVPATIVTPQPAAILPPGTIHPPAPLHGHNGFNAPPQSAYHAPQPKKLPVAEQVPRPTTFSKFRDLKTLSVLDMDTLECIPEIAECVHHCSHSLKHIRLSISDKLARKARKTLSADSVSDHTVSDDDLSDIHIQPPSASSAVANVSGTVLPESEKTQRSTQETAFARIFEYVPPTPKSEDLKSATDNVIANASKEMSAGLHTQTRDDVEKLFVKMLQTIFREARHKPKTASASVNHETLGKIEKAATKYLQNQEQSGKSKRVKTKKKAAQISKPSQVQPLFGNSGQASNHSSSGMSQSQINAFDFDDFLCNDSPDLQQQMAMDQQAQQQLAMAQQAHQLVFQGQQQTAYGQSLLQQAGHVTNGFAPYPPESLASPASYFPPPAKVPISHYAPEQAKAGNAKVKIASNYSTSDSESRCRSASADTDDPDKSVNERLQMKLDVNSGNDSAEAQEVFDDDVDMDHPDEDADEGEDQTFVDENQINDESGHDLGVDEAIPENVPQVIGSASEAERTAGAEETNEVLEVGKAKGKQAIRDPPNGTLAVSDSNAEPLKASSSMLHPPRVGSDSSVTKYLRLSHGLPLERLAIYLLPVKPSVLLRHIDIYSLKSLTLLNVGPQRTLWATLAKLNRQSPVPLNSIYTDNVTPSFLAFVNTLPEGQLEELFMLEHRPRAKVPQLHGCGKTLVDEEEIRRMILKKHMKNMKRLMIRNDDDDAWALGTAAVRLMARDGGKLRELAVQCGSGPFHSLVRALPSLRQLYALQITFIIDPVSHSVPMNLGYPPPHHPHHQTFPLTASGTILHELRSSVCDSLLRSEKSFELEYLGLSCVNESSSGASHGFGPAPVCLSRIYWEFVYGDGTSDDETGDKMWYANEPDAIAARERAGGGGNGGDQKELLVWTEDNVKMSDLEGTVKIWEKEIWAGRL